MCIHHETARPKCCIQLSVLQHDDTVSVTSEHEQKRTAYTVRLIVIYGLDELRAITQ